MYGLSRKGKVFKMMSIAVAAAGLFASLDLVFMGGDVQVARGCLAGGCARLARTVDGTFMGLPLALWGVLYWTGAIFLVIKGAGHGTASPEEWAEVASFWLAMGGAFSLGLVWLQYSAGAWCGTCLVSAGAALILGMTAFLPPAEGAVKGEERK